MSTITAAQTSTRDWQQAQRYLAHGVNSPVRAFGAVGGTPVFLERGRGQHVWSTQGRRYLDYVGGWGPQILGHAPQIVTKAVRAQIGQGTTLGFPTRQETALAKQICQAFPSIERLRCTCSGTEACMSAVRVARAATGRSKVIKFAGCYHGHADAMLVQAGSGVATFAGSGQPSSAGVPVASVEDTLIATYNDLSSVRKIMVSVGRDIAAIILEPCAGNMGVVPPAPGFLAGLRALTTEWGSLLIFDEVISGFRVGYGGMQHIEDVQPDLTVLGKIIGGGLPIGAFGGRAEIMAHLAPGGDAYQAGTLAGHPLAMVAGLAVLQELQRRKPYGGLAQCATRLASGIRQIAQETGTAVRVNSCGSLMSLFFTADPVENFADAQAANPKAYAVFFHAMLREGLLLPPSQFEAWFISAAHTELDIDRTLRAIRKIWEG